MLRSKVHWTEHGEKNSKYFLGLEKNNARNKIMHATFDDNHKLTKNPKEILNIQSRFYEKLYTSDNSIQTKIHIKPDRMINESQKAALDQDLRLELSEVVKGMAKDKTPGTSGFQVNLYIVF